MNDMKNQINDQFDDIQENDQEIQVRSRIRDRLRNKTDDKMIADDNVTDDQMIADDNETDDQMIADDNETTSKKTLVNTKKNIVTDKKNKNLPPKYEFKDKYEHNEEDDIYLPKKIYENEKNIKKNKTLLEELMEINKYNIIRKANTLSDKEITQIMSEEFNYSEWRPGQLCALSRIIRDERSVLMIAETGGGKSLVYQMAALILSRLEHSMCLVISPLISLIQDQLSKLKPGVNGLKGVALCGTVPPMQQQEIFDSMENGDVDILFIAPERLSVASFTSKLYKSRRKVGFACVDEAHCISEWSHTFRPSYLCVEKWLRNYVGVDRILALSATSTPLTTSCVQEVLNIPEDSVVSTSHRGTLTDDQLDVMFPGSKYEDEEELEVEGNPLGNFINTPWGKETTGSASPTADISQSAELRPVQRKNLILTVSKDRSAGRSLELLRTLIKTAPWNKMKSIIIYTWMTKEAENVQKYLHSREYPVGVYHGSMDHDKRNAIQKKFMKGDLRAIVATVALGMGLDKQDVEGVVHWNMPKSLEHYVQETGRCARDGRTGFCHLFLSSDSYVAQRNRTFNEDFNGADVTNLVTALLKGVTVKCPLQDALQDIEDIHDIEDINPETAQILEEYSAELPMYKTDESLYVFVNTRNFALKTNVNTEMISALIILLQKEICKSQNDIYNEINQKNIDPISMTVYEWVPSKIRLKLFDRPIESLADEGDELLKTMIKMDIKERSGNYTVETGDLLKNLPSSWDIGRVLSHLTFMHSKKLASAERLEHCLVIQIRGTVSYNAVGRAADSLFDKFTKVAHHGRRRLDACFLVLNSVADYSLDESLFKSVNFPSLKLHRNLQIYFSASGKEDLVDLFYEDEEEKDAARKAIFTGKDMQMGTKEWHSFEQDVSSKLVEVMESVSCSRPDDCAKFLCGISTQKNSSSMHRKHHLWNCYGNYKYEQIRNICCNYKNEKNKNKNTVEDENVGYETDLKLTIKDIIEKGIFPATLKESLYLYTIIYIQLYIYII
eukprot:GHVL01037616.1.p1 GENE.GHVL01037616.1~~GHVL01037616.1.p1  ORF type:complete len:1175 (+),score=304.89 GHVL01037616.1:488-3526(+)